MGVNNDGLLVDVAIYCLDSTGNKAAATRRPSSASTLYVAAACFYL